MNGYKGLNRLLSTMLLLVLLAACGQKPEVMYDYDEATLNDLQGPILQLINEEGLFGAHGCGTIRNEEEGYHYIYVDANLEEAVDYEAYKEHIYEVLGQRFPLEFNLTPFPEEPAILGVVHEVNFDNHNDVEDFLANILLVSEDKFYNNGDPEAMDVMVSKNAEIVDTSGHPYDLMAIEAGMKVASYYRGMTLESYPGQQGTEKLVVYVDEPRQFLVNTVDAWDFQNKYQSLNLSKAYPIIGRGWHYEKRLDEVRLRDIELSLYEGVEYYHYDDQGRDAYSYEGPIHMYVRDGREMKTNPFVIESTYLTGNFEPEFLDRNEDGLIDFAIPFYEEGQWLEKLYSISEDGLLEAMNDN